MALFIYKILLFAHYKIATPRPQVDKVRSIHGDDTHEELIVATQSIQHMPDQADGPSTRSGKVYRN